VCGVSGRIVLFGATGYTGALTARALVARGARPVLAGRSAERLQALAADLGGRLETAVVDATAPDAPQQLAALAGPGDVLVCTVGPFMRWGETGVRAAIASGAHYIDSTGEPPFIRTVFERHGPAARDAGCGLLTALGYDYVPGNLAGALALREAGPRAVSVDVGYFVSGRGPGAQASGGTRASAVGMLAEPGYAFRGGRLVGERAARHVGEVDGRAAISVGASEQFALPRLHPSLRDVRVWLGWFGPASRPLQALSAATALLTKVPGVRGAIGTTAGRFVHGSTGGPGEDARAAARSHIVAIASDAGGAPLATVRLEGVNPYDFTAAMLAWGAIRAVSGGLLGTGALGPADGFGLDTLVEGVADAGIARVL